MSGLHALDIAEDRLAILETSSAELVLGALHTQRGFGILFASSGNDCYKGMTNVILVGRRGISEGKLQMQQTAEG